jgi:putative transposase
LRAAGRLDRWNRPPSRKGTGFVQPLRPHQHWHIDIAYVNLAGTFFYLCTILDGYSRAVVHWELREAMRTAEVEIIVQRAREQVPEARHVQDQEEKRRTYDLEEYVPESAVEIFGR